jgi:hypothetical protein
MAYIPASPSPRPVERTDINPQQSAPIPRAKRTLSAQPQPSPRLVPRIQLSPRMDATRVETVTTVMTTTPHNAPPAPSPEETPRAEPEKGDSSPGKKSKKHSRHKTHDLVLPAPTLKAHRSRRSAGDKERHEVKPELKDSSPRLLKPQAPTTASQPAEHSPRTPKRLVQSASAKTSPRFTISPSPRNSPKGSPRFVIGLKQHPSSPTSRSQTDLPGDRPVQLGHSTPEKPANVQQRRAFFEGLAQSANRLPPVHDAAVPLTRSATAHSGSGKVSKLTESAGLPKVRSTRPHS